MLRLHVGKIGVVCFMLAEILDPPGKLGTRGQTLGRISVARYACVTSGLFSPKHDLHQQTPKITQYFD